MRTCYVQIKLNLQTLQVQLKFDCTGDGHLPSLVVRVFNKRVTLYSISYSFFMKSFHILSSEKHALLS